MWIGSAAAAAAATAVARRHVEPRELSQPRPLDLPTVVAQAVAKNQGTDAEQAFRAVGLTVVRRPGIKAREPDTNSDGSVLLPAGSPLSPPHLFWKAVVVAPSRTRGNVGAWLEAKFGGGGEGGSTYRQDLDSHGLCPGLDVGGGIEDHKEVACGSSGNSKLIYRALRYAVFFHCCSSCQTKQIIQPFLLTTTFTGWGVLCAATVM